MNEPTSLNKFELLRKLVEISNSTVTASTKLQNILKCIVRELGMDRCYIFGLDGEFNNMVLRAASDPVADVTMDTVIPLGEGFVGRAARDKAVAVGDGEEYPEEPESWRQYRYRVAFPILDDTFIYGSLALLSSERDLDTGLYPLMETVCLLLAGTIRYFRLSMDAKKRIAERTAFFEIGKAISGTMGLQKLVDEVVLICAKVVSARGALLTVFDVEQDEVAVRSAFGVRKPGESPPLCVALEFSGRLEGTLCVFEKFSWENGKPIPFDDDDHRLLMALGSFLSSPLEKSLVFAKMEGLVARNDLLVRRLSSLYDISSHLMTTVDFERILDIILEAVLFKEGMAFDRAFLLLLNEEGVLLRVHRAMFRPRLPKEDAEENRSTVSEEPPIGSEPSEVLGLELPMNADGGPLAQCLLSGRVLKVTGPVTDLSDPVRRIYSILGPNFAAVPLMAKTKSMGILVVDHGYDQREITDPELQTLDMLAHQAGLAMENARLYAFIDGVNKELRDARERLLETEKMAALGEVAAGIAHEIRNPLVSIGGFARRVLKTVDKDSPIKEYLSVIVMEVERLEKTLKEVLSFSQDKDEGNFEYLDLHRTIEAALSYLSLELEAGSVTLRRDFSEVPEIFGDERQLRHLFFNLFLNALQAMKEGGELSVRTFSYVDESLQRKFAAVEVTDSGGGIPTNVLQNIFNPFFTSKAQGTGLGLSIVHRIVKRHQGEIDVENKPGKGASFTVRFPVMGKTTGLVSTK